MSSAVGCRSRLELSLRFPITDRLYLRIIKEKKISWLKENYYFLEPINLFFHDLESSFTLFLRGAEPALRYGSAPSGL